MLIIELTPIKTISLKRLIDLRNEVKGRLKHAPGDERNTLEAEQLALKIVANSTSYGIFIELNVEDLPSAEDRLSSLRL